MSYVHEKRIILVIRGKVTPKKRTLHGYVCMICLYIDCGEWGLPRPRAAKGGRKFNVPGPSKKKKMFAALSRAVALPKFNRVAVRAMGMLIRRDTTPLILVCSPVLFASPGLKMTDWLQAVVPTQPSSSSACLRSHRATRKSRAPMCLLLRRGKPWA
jgi:hypothetical protein